MMNDELDLLECRLTELQEVDNLRHVLIEAEIDHQGHPKPLYYADNRSRFDAWNSRIVHVVAGYMPTYAMDPNPWSREHAQREHARFGLTEAGPGDIVLHGDLDEIPRQWAAEHDPGNGLVGTDMRDHTWAVDWLGPDWFRGTVITRVRNVQSFAALRYRRNDEPRLPDAGWHLTGLGGPDAFRRKLNSFCHLEMREMLEKGNDAGLFYERGFLWGPEPDLELGAVRLKPVEVDESWPRYIREGKAPAMWFRPRDVKEEANAV